MNGRSGMNPSAAFAASGSRREIVTVDDDAAGSRLQQPGDHADARRLAGAVRTEEAVNLPGRHAQRDAVDRREAAVALDEILDGDHRPPPAHGDAQQPQACASRNVDRQRTRIASPAGRPGSASLFGATSTSSHTHLRLADQRQDRRLLVEAAAREPHVRRIRRELIERRIDRQPQAPARCLRRCRPRATRGNRTRRARRRGRR